MSIEMLARSFFEDVKKERDILKATRRVVLGPDDHPFYHALSRVVTYTIPDSKLLWSVDAGRDIGTPETVRRMLEGAATEEFYWKQLWDNREQLWERKGVDATAFRNLLIVDYLTAFGETSGGCPLTGELKRSLAQEKGLADWVAAANAGALPITPYVVGNYCEKHELGSFYAVLLAASMETPYWRIRTELARQMSRAAKPQDKLTV